MEEPSGARRLVPDEPAVQISLVVPDEARPTLAAFRDECSELDAVTVGLVDELLDRGRATLRPGWAASAGAGAGEPDRGDDHIS